MNIKIYYSICAVLSLYNIGMYYVILFLSTFKNVDVIKNEKKNIIGNLIKNKYWYIIKYNI